jgi:hypothetical protein
MKANHKDVQLDGALIRRGQLPTSYYELYDKPGCDLVF